MSNYDALREEIRQIQSKHRARPESMRGQKVPYYRRGEMSIPAFKMKPGGNVETDGKPAEPQADEQGSHAAQSTSSSTTSRTRPRTTPTTRCGLASSSSRR